MWCICNGYRKWRLRILKPLGLGLKEYLELKHAMVAIDVQYRKAEKIILRTWLNDLKILSANSFVLRTKVFYLQECIEIATGRPKRMSPTFRLIR